MPAKDPRSPLTDILSAISTVRAWIEKKTYVDYQNDRMLRAAIERQVEIVSEASRRVPDELKTTRPDIPWRDVATVGNALRHKYDGISDPEIWSIVTLDFPALETAGACDAAKFGPKALSHRFTSLVRLRGKADNTATIR